MTAIRVRNPALMDRLRIQALLRGIADQRGEAEMLRILTQALTTEFRRFDHQKAINTACSEPQENS
jgi:plasmid stability protein